MTVDDLINYEKKDSLGLEVPPKGKHIFGMVKVGEKGQIVIPKEARKLFQVEPGDTLLILGDERNGIIVTKPDVIRDAATQIFENLGSREEDEHNGTV